MKARSHHQDEQHLTEQLGATGLRLTPQRQQVYDVLLHKRDHPTAEEVFIRAKKQMPEISHATVYNCLDALVKCGLARQVHVGSRRDALLPEHAGALPFLLRFVRDRFRRGPADGHTAMTLPKGFKAEHYDIAIHGTLRRIARQKRQK